MKNMIILMLLLSTLNAFGQKKGKVDPKDVAIDSLSRTITLISTQLDSTKSKNSALTMQIDSVQKVNSTYQTMYTEIREKVVMHDFNPAETAKLIDSLHITREAVLSDLTSKNKLLTDSLTSLQKQATDLKIAVEQLKAAEADKAKLVAELKQLKELLDAKIITQAEFDEKKSSLLAKWE